MTEHSDIYLQDCPAGLCGDTLVWLQLLCVTISGSMLPWKRSWLLSGSFAGMQADIMLGLFPSPTITWDGSWRPLLSLFPCSSGGLCLLFCPSSTVTAVLGIRTIFPVPLFPVVPDNMSSVFAYLRISSLTLEGNQKIGLKSKLINKMMFLSYELRLDNSVARYDGTHP